MRFELEAATLMRGGTAVIEGVDLTLAHGEAVGLVGPSGAGKTSLLRMLSTELAPATGRVQIDGANPATLDARELRKLRSRIGFVHQQHALVPELRVLQNIVAGRFGSRGTFAGLRSLLWPRRADLSDIHEVLERVGIGELMYRRTSSLSGGEQQRVAIARALFQEPLALLADEPVASVDPARARATIQLLVDLARERGVTLIVSLHDLELARDLIPRLVGLRDGRVAFDLPTEQVDEAHIGELYRLPAAGI